MDRKDEIIKLQMDVISQMTRNNLRRLSDDLWGNPDPVKPLGEMPDLNASIPDDFLKELNELGNIPAAPVSPSQPLQPSASAGQTEAAPAAAQEAEKEEEPEKIEDLKKELEGYIGLSTVKKEVESLINLVTIQNLRRENGLPVKDLSLHMVFSGNPGTGKTMIARLMARIYKSLGILSKGQLVEVDRSGLVAGFVGQTAGKTQEVIQSAMGGVLFIDEAYALTNKGGNDFGQEAVDTLLKAMEDHRDDLIVIVAGYTELMKEFVHSNPGLESRFNRFLEFPDYTVDEMMDIFAMRCRQSGYELAEEGRDLLRTLLALYSLDIDGFGNARGVRNLFERAVSAQANRLAGQESITREELMLLTADDIRVAGGGPENGGEADGENAEAPEDSTPEENGENA